MPKPKTTPDPSIFDNPFTQAMQLMFSVPKPEATSQPNPFLDNPFAKAFQEMMGGLGQQPAAPTKTKTPEAPKEEAKVNADNPWPGLEHFTENLRGYFFGRDAEGAELFRRVKQKTLTLLFGQSGLGKSSLLQASLFPRLRAGGLLPVYIRFDLRAAAPPLTSQVKEHLRAALAPAQPGGAPLAKDEESLWQWFHRRDVALARADGSPIVPVLVFDQFEELFTIGAENPQREPI